MSGLGAQILGWLAGVIFDLSVIGLVVYYGHKLVMELKGE